jgi:hypothetical protein
VRTFSRLRHLLLQPRLLFQLLDGRTSQWVNLEDAAEQFCTRARVQQFGNARSLFAPASSCVHGE